MSTSATPPALGSPAPNGEPASYLYRRIEAAIRNLVRDERLRPGDRLPSENELSSQFGTTRVTVAKAIAALERDGLVTRLVGRGTFVAAPAPITAAVDMRRCYSFEEQVGLTGHTVSFRLLEFARVSPPEFARVQLNLAPGEPVYRLERQRIVGGRVVGLELRFIPPDLAARITAPMLAEQSVLDIVGAVPGEPVATIAVTLYAELVGRDTAEKLGVAAGSPVTVRDHIYRDADGRVLLCGQNVFTSDVRLSYVLGAAPSDPK